MTCSGAVARELCLDRADQLRNVLIFVNQDRPSALLQVPRRIRFSHLSLAWIMEA